MHKPACASWEQHVERAYAALRDGDDYDLPTFTDFLMSSYDDERLAADVEAGEGPFAERRDWPIKWDDIKKAKGAA